MMREIPKIEQFSIDEFFGDVKRNKPLFYSWKKPGIQLYHRVTGTCGEGIESRGDRKSIGISRTFDPIHDSDEIKRLDFNNDLEEKKLSEKIQELWSRFGLEIVKTGNEL